MYAQATIKRNTIPRNGAHRIVSREVQKCARGCSSLGSRKKFPLYCIKLDTAIDPCMGSGHILVYAFDVLMEIYRESGYSERDAAVSIIQNNLFGLDIDAFAAQLAYFAVMMRAREYDRRFFGRGITPHVMAIAESDDIEDAKQTEVPRHDAENEISRYLWKIFQNAKEFGSLLIVEKKDYDGYLHFLETFETEGQMNFESSTWEKLRPLLKQFAEQAKILSEKYQIVCTNPPYLNKFEGSFKTFLTKNYKDYSGDLFSAFIYRNLLFCKEGGYSGYMTPFVWMFIKTYEKLRAYIIQNKSITTLVQMEYSAFEEATVPICSFVLKNGRSEEKGLYFKLSDFKGGMEIQKKKILEAIADKNCSYFYETAAKNFSKIPGSPISAYYATKKILEAFENSSSLFKIAPVKRGMCTCANELFYKNWFEIEIKEFQTGKDRESANGWIPLNKGGEYRKWYGNLSEVVDWHDHGKRIRKFPTAQIKNEDFYFLPSITWSSITSGEFSVRCTEKGFIFDQASNGIFPLEYRYYIAGLLNSKIVKSILDIINPSLNKLVGDLSEIPVIYNDVEHSEKLVKSCIQVSKMDWDIDEISWNFKKHPLAE